MYELATLGTVRLRRRTTVSPFDGADRIAPHVKPLALLIHLALQHGQRCRRDTLVATFWPESDGGRARNALSATLGRIRRQLGEALIIAGDAQEVALAPGALETDVDRFRRALRDRAWAHALEQYSGDFLDGFHLPDAPAFDAWVSATRTELRRDMVAASMQRVDELVAAGESSAAAGVLQRARCVAPTDEPVARCLMEILHAAGESAAALRVYDELVETLRTDIGTAASAATRGIADGIRRTAVLHAIAVLPWMNLTGDAGRDDVTDGFTDLLTTELALSFPGRVISRQSCLQLKGSDRSLRDVGELLHVDGVVEGSISCFGDGITVTAQLLRVEPEGHLWADRVQTRINELPAVAKSIAAAVERAVFGADGRTPGRHTQDGERRAHSGHTASRATTRAEDTTTPIPAAAWEAYLRARHHATTPQTLEKAVVHYRECLQMAPDHALSWAGLASAYAVLTLFAVRSPAELFPPFRKAAERAVALDPELGEAHTSLGLYRMLADRDWAGCEHALRRGASLARGHVEPHRHLALFLAAMGRFDEAHRECAAAATLDPIGPTTAFTRAWCLYKQGHHAESNDVFDDLLELHPRVVLARVYRGLNLALLERTDQAARDVGLALDALPDEPEVLALGAAALGRADRRDAARSALGRLLEMEKQRYIDPWAVGVACAGLDRHDDALHWLRRMYDERSPSAFCIRFDPMLDPLRSDPRFMDIERRLAFPRQHAG